MVQMATQLVVEVLHVDVLDSAADLSCEPDREGRVVHEAQYAAARGLRDLNGRWVEWSEGSQPERFVLERVRDQRHDKRAGVAESGRSDIDREHGGRQSPHVSATGTCVDRASIGVRIEEIQTALRAYRRELGIMNRQLQLQDQVVTQVV